LIDFAVALAMAAQLASHEPLTQLQAPRAVALEVARIADSVDEAALLLVVAWHEGRFRLYVRGDGGQSVCTMQVQGDAGAYYDLRRCVETGMRKLRRSAEACPDHPLAVYASGRCDWAWGISDARVREASALAPTSQK
jgi:hypothetical protein